MRGDRKSVRRWVAWIGASLAGLSAVQPAVAATVVLKCTVRSGNPDPILNFGGPGAAVIFKIGDDQWLVWDDKAGKWQRDSCRVAGFFYVNNEGTSGGCTFTATSFQAEILHSEQNASVDTSQKIDRVSGEWLVKSSNRLRGYPPDLAEVRGDCEPTTEPKPAPPPKVKF